ncbi:AAA family ATPase [Methylobacterium sp. WL64]|uniref:AAA family ATPase n=1 Tax=Methylobacterium sp. WL64 TaxID=2603894 RepID=UPI0016503A0C|nr:AAA family ATPase [Methylobacterium sp. WL64]
MLDVAYLLDSPPIPGAVIYEYRTGALLQRVREALTALAEKEDRIVRLSKPSELLANLVETSLFEPRQLELCDWKTGAVPKASERDLDAILRAFAVRTDQRIALFVPAGCELTRRPSWLSVRAASFVLEEPAVTCETLEPVLRYLEASTDLADQPDLLRQEGFVARFAEMLADKPNLFTLIRAFDEVVVTATDPVSNRYDQAQHRRATLKRRARASVSDHLKGLLAGSDSWDAVRLVAALDARRWRRGWSARTVMGELYELTARLLKDGHGGPNADSRHIVLWTALILAAEGELVPTKARTAHRSRVTADGLTLGLDRLVRAYIARSGVDLADPLSGVWGRLDRTLGRMTEGEAGSPEGSRDKLLRALADALPSVSGQVDPLWLRRLAQRVRDTLEAVDTAPDASTVENAAFDPRGRVGTLATFDEVLGHGHVVKALRQRVRRADHGTGLLLYGPPGVGKRTLACLYAKAVLCDEPTPQGASCNRCEACREFERTGGLGYGYADLARTDARDRARDLVRIARTAAFSKRVVLLIANVDACEADAFDVLLKTLETPPAGVTFVLMGRDLREMRLAGVSRCRVYRMRPVTALQAQVYTRSLLETHGVACDEQVVSVLAAAAGGRPGSLRSLCERAAGLPACTLPALRAALDLNWVGPTAAWMRAALDSRPVPTVPAPADTTNRRDEILRRIRAIVLHLRLQDVAGADLDKISADPALLHHEDDELEALNASIEQQAAERGVGALVLRQSLARDCLSDDHREIEELRWAEPAGSSRA